MTCDTSVGGLRLLLQKLVIQLAEKVLGVVGGVLELREQHGQVHVLEPAPLGAIDEEVSLGEAGPESRHVSAQIRCVHDVCAGRDDLLHGLHVARLPPRFLGSLVDIG